MTTLDPAVFLIESSDEKNKRFGTGFAVARDGDAAILLTCAHVVDDVGGPDRISVKRQPAEVLASGDRNGNDLALIRVAGLECQTILDRFATGSQGGPIQICGYGPFGNDTCKKRRLDGGLGQSDSITPRGGTEDFQIWDLVIEDEHFSKLQGGCSGSPVCDATGQVVAVTTAREDDKRGYALCISNLWRLDDPIAQWIPAIIRPQPTDRFERICNALKDPERAAGIESIHEQILADLTQLASKDTLSNEEEARLNVVKMFADGAMDPATFTIVWQSQSPKPPGPAAGIDYARLAGRLRDGEVALFLGPDLPALSGVDIPIAADLPRRVREALPARIADEVARDFHSAGNSLPELCEFVDLNPEGRRSHLVEALQRVTAVDEAPAPPFYALLATLETPLLICSAAYDDLLERALRHQRRPFVVISRAPKEEREAGLVLEYNTDTARKTARCAADELAGLGLMETPPYYSLIFKLRGRHFTEQRKDSLLLTERDYLDFVQTLSRAIPDYLISLLAERHVWFLGYRPVAWEDRFLAKALLARRLNSGTSQEILIVQDQFDAFARNFWNDFTRVTLLDADPDAFMTGLEQAQ